MTAQTEVIDAFGKHSGEKQSVVADVFAHLALAVKRRSGAVDGIGLQQHFSDVGQWTVRGIANLEKLLGFTELGQQMRDISDDLRIANADLFGVMPSDKILK